MLKKTAIELLGGSISKAAEAIGVTYQAVDKWPDELPPRIADRVYAYLWKQQHEQNALAQLAAQPIAAEKAA